VASNSIVRAYRELLSELNTTYPQYVMMMMMMALWEQYKITIAAWLQKTAIDGGAMAQISKKMADKNLLDIVKKQQDRRKRFVRLTQPGQTLKNEALNIPNQVSCKFNNIDGEQTKQLMQLLDCVVNDLAELP
jgi:DNA-binding MarR family transcriptional regulator